MAADMGFELRGLDELLGKLKSLEEEPKRKSTRFALRKAANVVRDAAQANAEKLDDPLTSESIAANVVVRWDGQRFKRTGDLTFSVGVRGGSTSKSKNATNPGGDTWYFRLLEFGTEKMAARPFMRPALESSIDPATDEFLKHFDKAITRAIKRANMAKAAR